MILRPIAICALLAMLAGCGIEAYGKADIYDIHSRSKIPVVMPPGAPYMSEQFYGPGEIGDKEHLGIDIYALRGTPILAAAPGRVERAFYDPAYGHQIVIDHGPDETGKRVRTAYKHLYERTATEGQSVARGAPIGTMGATGALGMMVHLHFEVLRDLPNARQTAFDPNLFWMQGPGRVTCFRPGTTYPDQPFRTTYPVPCRPG